MLLLAMEIINNSQESSTSMLKFLIKEQRTHYIANFVF